LDPPHWNEREWVPAFLFGFRYRPRPTPDTHDLSFMLGTTVFTDVTLPLTPLLEVEAGCRRVRSECKLELGVQTSLLIPLTEGFSLGVTPLSLTGAIGEDHVVTLGANRVRADLFLLESLWLSVSGPRYDSIRRAFDAELVSFAFGFAWNGKQFQRPNAPGGVRF